MKRYKFIQTSFFPDLQVRLLRQGFEVEPQLKQTSEQGNFVLKMVLFEDGEQLFMCTKLDDLYEYLLQQMGRRWMLAEGFMMEEDHD